MEKLSKEIIDLFNIKLLGERFRRNDMAKYPKDFENLFHHLRPILEELPNKDPKFQGKSFTLAQGFVHLPLCPMVDGQAKSDIVAVCLTNTFTGEQHFFNVGTLLPDFEL